MQRGMNTVRSSEAKVSLHIFYYTVYKRGIISFGKKHWYSSV